MGEGQRVVQEDAGKEATLRRCHVSKNLKDTRKGHSTKREQHVQRP